MLSLQHETSPCQGSKLAHLKRQQREVDGDPASRILRRSGCSQGNRSWWHLPYSLVTGLWYRAAGHAGQCLCWQSYSLRVDIRDSKCRKLCWSYGNCKEPCEKGLLEGAIIMHLLQIMYISYIVQLDKVVYRCDYAYIVLYILTMYAPVSSDPPIQRNFHPYVNLAISSVVFRDFTHQIFQIV